MKKIFLIATITFACIFSAQAQVESTGGYMPSQGLQEYFSANRNNYSKSIIYIFFNNQPCYNCATAIEMIEQLYDRKYIDEYNMFMINYQNDDENNFIQTYQLSKPLEVVLVRIDDGASFGYKKVENLENMTTDPNSFDEYLSEEINNYLARDFYD